MAKVQKALSDRNDLMALPMYTLLKTYMRVGNETYFKAHGHKGLTTLTKDNVKVDAHKISFEYVGKDGVPINICQEFPDAYVCRLKNILGHLHKNDFVFTKNHELLREHDFKSAFKKYCGEEFYPHIVRSHYATTKVKNFLSKHQRASKEEVQELFMSIAHDLGHKKFNKKAKRWEESYKVSVNSYVLPELVKKVERIVVK
jgi:DNA topoisomerase IB